MPPLDWSRGRYENTAAELLPAAEQLVSTAAIVPGERVLDLGCGTGSVAILAARRGAVVTGVDPAPRLLAVAEEVSRSEGLTVQYLPGHAAELPVESGSIDAVLSNFALIFAPAPSAAVAESVRVLAPEGRIVFTAWVPGSAAGRMSTVAMELVREALGGPVPPPAFRWHERDELAPLFEAHDMELTIDQHQLSFTADSPEAYLDAQANHPMAVAGVEVMQRLGLAEAGRSRLLEVVHEANEDPAAFRTTSHYVVVTATPRSTTGA